LLGNELTKKATTLNDDDDPYHEDLPRRRQNDESDEEGEGEGNRKSKKLRVVNEAAESLDAILGSGGGENSEAELNGKYKALFDMDFMKKARQQQQLRAKEDAQSLLREIEQMEGGDSDDEEGEGDGASDTEEQKREKAKKKKEMAQQHKDKLELARKQMTSMMNGKKGLSLTTTAVATAAVVHPTNESSSIIEKTQSNPWLDATAASNTAKSRDLNVMIGEASQGKNQKTKKRNRNAVLKSEENGTNNGGASGSVKILLPSANDNANAKPSEQKKKAPPPSSEKLDQARKPLLMQKSQQDLVSLAFSGPDYEADFEVLKEKIIDEELNISDKKRKILSEGMTAAAFSPSSSLHRTYHLHR
jgi:U3 small nucleolar RNA-associated protein 14